MMGPRVTFSTTKALAALPPLWGDVVVGEAPDGWADEIPPDVYEATLAKLPSPGADVSFSVTLQDEATVLFTATGRAA